MASSDGAVGRSPDLATTERTRPPPPPAWPGLCIPAC